MNQLTVRGLDIELNKALKQEAAEQGVSVNRLVVQVLREAVGLYATAPTVREFHDLDHLAGTWNTADAAEFDDALNEQRQIDAELWQ